MRLIHSYAVPAEHRTSPGGTFEVFRQHISLALSGVKDTGPWGGGHPFDIELTRLPPGKKNYPYHAHAAQTEYYIILAGTGQITDETGQTISTKAGDHIIFFPGEAHQIANNSSDDLEYLVIADHHRADVTTYPHTGKRQIKPEMRCIRPIDADYYEGEE